MAEAQSQQSLLPDDFLSEPAEDIKINKIDFSETELPEYDFAYAVIIDNALSETECRTLLQAAEASAPETSWERAMVNTGGGKQALHTGVRSCGRIIWDSREVVAKIMSRIEHLPEVQEILRLENQPDITGGGPSLRREVWSYTRANERMRFLKYEGGEYFRPHCDGRYETPDRKERSYVTVHLYLNSTGVPSEQEMAKMSDEEREAAAAKRGLKGGATTFHSFSMKKKLGVEPEAGRILLFSQRDLMHSGDDVIEGVKYTMRTDLMYALDGSDGSGK